MMSIFTPNFILKINQKVCYEFYKNQNRKEINFIGKWAAESANSSYMYNDQGIKGCPSTIQLQITLGKYQYSENLWV